MGQLCSPQLPLHPPCSSCRWARQDHGGLFCIHWGASFDSPVIQRLGCRCPYWQAKPAQDPLAVSEGR